MNNPTDRLLMLGPDMGLSLATRLGRAIMKTRALNVTRRFASLFLLCLLLGVGDSVPVRAQPFTFNPWYVRDLVGPVRHVIMHNQSAIQGERFGDFGSTEIMFDLKGRCTTVVHHTHRPHRDPPWEEHYEYDERGTIVRMRVREIRPRAAGRMPDDQNEPFDYEIQYDNRYDRDGRLILRSRIVTRARSDTSSPQSRDLPDAGPMGSGYGAIEVMEIDWTSQDEYCTTTWWFTDSSRNVRVMDEDGNEKVEYVRDSLPPRWMRMSSRTSVDTVTDIAYVLCEGPDACDRFGNWLCMFRVHRRSSELTGIAYVREITYYPLPGDDTDP